MAVAVFDIKGQNTTAGTRLNKKAVMLKVAGRREWREEQGNNVRMSV